MEMCMEKLLEHMGSVATAAIQISLTSWTFVTPVC